MVNLSPEISSGGTFEAKFRQDTTNVAPNMGIVNATSNDYNDLNNLPSINGNVLKGNKTSEELGIVGDKHYVHNQRIAADVWTIVHNLDKFPSVTVVDSGNNVVVGEIVYINNNTVQVSFSGEFSGSAYLN